MKFIASSTALHKQLQQINGVISSSAVIPILEYFLFEVKDGHLVMTGTDLEVSMRSRMEVEAKEDGRIAVPAKIILDILKTLPDQPLTFTINEENKSIQLTSDSGQYKISGENPEDFPKFPEVDEANEVTLSAAMLDQALHSTIFAIGTDDLRPALTGLNLELRDDGVTMVSTDGNKLVKYERNGMDVNVSDQFIIPKKALTLLRNTLPGGDEEVKLTYNKVNVLFSFGEVKLICRLIDERFPDYNAAIPKEAPNELRLERQPFVSALKRISIFSNKTTYQVKFSMNGGELELSAQDVDYSNEAHEKLPCEYQGDAMEIAFNAKYLSEMLGTIDSDEVTISLSAYNRPGILRPSEVEEGEDVLMLLMPIVVNV